MVLTRWVRPPPRETAGRFRRLRARDLLDARDQLVRRLIDRNLLVDDPVRGLRPHILVIEDGELPVLHELERHRAGLELLVDGLAVAVLLPERASPALPSSPGTSAQARPRHRVSGSLPGAGRRRTPSPSC